MERYYLKPDMTGRHVFVYDLLSTEPVCLIFSKHQYRNVQQVIINALNASVPKLDTDVCECGKIKPKVLLDCGCKKPGGA